MKIRCVWEHNGSDTILYADGFPGAFAATLTVVLPSFIIILLVTALL